VIRSDILTPDTTQLIRCLCDLVVAHDL
jgi:hypothetical protein